MAGDVARKQPKVVDYETMVGRGRDEEDALVELDSMIEGDHEGDVVAVEVSNWKPHKERVLSAPSWADAKKDPRFVEKKPDRNPDAPPSPDPNYEFLKPRQGVGVVNFGLQPERWAEDADEEEVIREQLGEAGYAHDRAALRDAAAMDHAVERAEEKQSKNKKEPMMVNMGKQQRRKDNTVKSAAPDVVYDVKEDRREKGVLDWHTQQGRDAKVITKEKIPDEVYSDDEEVIVDPDSDKRSRRVLQR